MLFRSAMAWLGGGWIIFKATLWIRANQDKPTPFPWKDFILPIAACMVLPSFILLGGAKFYTLRDDFQTGLLKNVAEVLPLLTRIEMGAITWKVAFGYFPVFVIAALVLIFLPKFCSAAKGGFLVLVCPIIIVTCMQFAQVRWGMLNGPIYIALAGVLIPQVWNILPKKNAFRAIGALCLAAPWPGQARTVWGDHQRFKIGRAHV